jgi:predicted unusual protein kinase regulating ubiquinone biosynthesis (AarF/ABC1/UbiB family)
VLVTDWVEARDFRVMKTLPDLERDRLGEILYRFYFATAAEHGLALGDPHPGNLLHAPDGRLVALDFGLVRTLPPGYTEREAKIYRALTDEDAAGLHAALDELGYLTQPVDDELLLRYFLLSGDYAIAMARDAMDLGPEWLAMVRSFDVPPEALLLRRMENLVFSVLCDLRAAADWHALGDELRAGLDARTELGREHAAWREARGVPARA